jgi:hypothetical protein
VTPTTHEQTLNIDLADLLKTRGLDAEPELQYSSGRPDVELRIPPVTVALEAKIGQTNAKKLEAIKDSKLRLEQGLAQCGIALCYPAGTTRETLPECDFTWAVYDGTSDKPDWTTGNLNQLAQAVQLVPSQLGNPDVVAKALSNSLDRAVGMLSESQKQTMAKALDLPPRLVKGKASWNQPAKRALLLVATAVMFHAKLDQHLGDLKPDQDNRLDPPEPFEGPWPPAMAHIFDTSADPIQHFLDAWKLILALDYKPIFETAIAALYSCHQDPGFTSAINETAKAAINVSRNIAGLRHDLMGRIFHTVLDTAPYDGSFYTTTAAATLLATLAIPDDLYDWGNPDTVTNLRITDPACGTGTLLMAAAERIHDLVPLSRDDTQVAQSLIEQVLSGYDVNLTATHMAATTLGLLSPTTRFQNMKIGRALLGVDDANNTYLGSLEFLDQQPKLLSWPNAAQPVSQVDTGKQMSHDPADLVIMNPPFTRDSLRHNQFSEKDEKKIKAREKQLFANKPTYMAGNSGAFLFLADFISKADSSTIAAILPLTGATDKSGHGMRRYLADRFHIETIVTSHDPERIYFSENTDIGEILLICRRWPTGKGPKPATQVINLIVNPSTPSEAISTAWAIANKEVESRGHGTVQLWPRSRIASGDWGAVQFLSPYLCEQFIDLKEGRHFPTVRLDTLTSVGPAGQRIRDAFTKSSVPNANGQRALWFHDTEVTQSIAGKTDTHISAKPSKKKLAEKYWGQRGRLLLPHRMRLNTVRSFAVRLDIPALGSSWTPCNVIQEGTDKEDLEKSISVYLNSSAGILAMLGSRSNRVPSYPRYSLDDLRSIPIPDFKAFGPTTIQRLAETYDKLSEAELKPLPELEICETRRELDTAVAHGLGLGWETVATIRQNLASEPSVRAERYTGFQPTP